MEKQEEIHSGGVGRTPVCGIGASAGGVHALQALFRKLPDDLGLAYVVVVHLAPEHPSALSEILRNATGMSVLQVEDTPKLRPNCVYVIAPDKELVIEDGALHARPFTEPRGTRAPIDMFFRSIAQNGGDGIAVVLTGAGSDGAVGVGAVKEAGGVILVQDPKDAEFPSMPQSAIATGLADFVAPIPALAELIVDLARSKKAVRSLDEDGAANQIRRIVNFLHARTGNDFSSYKRATVMRRMQVKGVLNLNDYANLLQEQPEEGNELFQDMLISVTQFFRDPEAFDVLAKEVISPLFDDLKPDGLRAWVAGCATGEEAYSLAIVIKEEMERRNVQVPVQIFATDLDQGALATAREGIYPHAIEADVSERRLQSYFIEEGSHYRIRKEVREMVLFASHSVLKDPPFLNLDLVCCRNLLIYLERALQEKLCSLFSYSLRQNRFLFLGSAESADVANELFVPLNREARIYQCSRKVSMGLPILSQFRHRPWGGPERPDRSSQTDREPAQNHAAALETAAPPSIIVGEGHHIVHLSPSAGKYILHSGGQFSGRISSVVRPELRLDLAHALDRALDQKQPTLTLPVSVAFNGEQRRVAMNVLPADGGQNGVWQALVLFLDGGIVEPEAERFEGSEPRPDELRRLHAELKAAKEALAQSRGEHEFSVQELRAANEELQSINEEYRSTAEELETSKEELQSMNEELHTVNSALKDKLENISTAHSDLRNLTAATEIGTLFLDKQLRIRMFTPPVAELFNVTEADVGRPLTDFTHRLDRGGIEDDLCKVLRNLSPTENEVKASDGRWFMMRIRPYRTIEDHIEGVVVTFVDISSRRKAEERVMESEARYRALFNSIDQGFCVIEMLFDEGGKPADYRFLEVNKAFEGQTGLANAIGRTMRELEPNHEDHWFEIYGRVARSREPEHFEAQAEHLQGRCYQVFAFPFGEPEGRQVGVLFQDITERKEAEHERELLTQELSHRVKNTLAVVQSLASHTSRESRSIEHFRDTFIGRLHALGRAHALLLETQWQSADMEKLIARSLEAYDDVAAGDDTVTISGPSLLLTPKQGLGLSLILHELFTNAAKYGGLCTPEGRLDVRWSVENQDGTDSVHLLWQERGGPPVQQPNRRGFGTNLIERSCQFELHGTAELKFPPGGFEAEIRFPLG